MEDIQLCKIWLDVTQEPVIGTNQTGNGFWNHITKKYMLAIPDPFQTPVGLKSCWCTLQAAINKFSGCVKQIKHHPQKGFCPYFLLQNPGNAPKWIEYITNLHDKLASQKQKRQDTTTTIACLSEPPSHALLTTESSTRQTERPSGQKKSKNDQQRTETWQQADELYRRRLALDG
ncbi:hypothetical protein PCANC_21391 [Puccinia coronata f. sp. avenae]|uniref:No apical meristem-associated C-terminal domain-containing protein n=1 Tax=Puccinia coronata f. sp. avenae TaxID=200324 RepID=A0A2N5UBY5_9BASI|nr:hypothetical protein PCANC_21391 [Puccinia coronata f. sp. avenae]